MRIWYGEDLAGWTEADNAGRACVDVYAKFVLNHGTDINAL
ncbi:hypothetical protein QZH41_016922 [Actinostola sp. cb2023]|nr:hypothetical protein QZH41_016922 [Actinostola sp. cb2023]